MKLKLLQETRGGLVKQVRQIIDAATAENRGLNADESAKLATIEGEIDGLSATIDAEVRQLSRESAKPATFSKQESRDIERFNFAKVLRHLDKTFKGQPSQVEGIEAEMIQEGESEMRSAGLNASGIAIPQMLLVNRRDLSVTGGTTDQYGGALVGTEKKGLLGDFYNKGVLESSGAMVLNGLVGNVDLPRYVKGTAPLKKTENEAAGDVSGTFTDLNLSPKRLPGYVTISDQLLAQSPQVLETFVGGEISKHMLAVREAAFFHGGGTSEPTGIAATSGIGSVAGGTNGAAPDWSDMVDLETAVDTDNALEGSLAYFTNGAVRGKLKKTAKVASTDSKMVWEGNEINGYGVKVTNAISRTLTKGNQSLSSAIFFGNASDFVVGYWGGLDLSMVRDVTSAKAGNRTLVANQYYDAGVLRAESFSAMLDALTA
jgi:HK97 family phage major capsid protein